MYSDTRLKTAMVPKVKRGDFVITTGDRTVWQVTGIEQGDEQRRESPLPSMLDLRQVSDWSVTTRVPKDCVIPLRKVANAIVRGRQAHDDA